MLVKYNIMEPGNRPFDIGRECRGYYTRLVEIGEIRWCGM